jgi:hypothetical protein
VVSPVNGTPPLSKKLPRNAGSPLSGSSVSPGKSEMAAGKPPLTPVKEPSRVVAPVGAIVLKSTVRELVPFAMSASYGGSV